MTQQRLLPPRLQVVPKTPAPAMTAIEQAADVPTPPDQGDYWLYGIEAIRAFLDLPTKDHVYRIKARAGAPIAKIPGIGLAARAKDLEDWRAAYLPSGKRSA